MPTIRPNLWFDGNALEAAEFYVSVFCELGGPPRDAVHRGGPG